MGTAARADCAPVFIVASVLAATYVLSIGPSYWAWRDHRIANQTFGAVYRPVLWLYGQSRTTESIGDWYLGLWYPPDQ